MNSNINQNNQITLLDSAIERVCEIKKKDDKKFLRITVDSGGCSGFQYIFAIEDGSLKEDDVEIFHNDNGIIAVTDNTSLQFLSGCKIEFIKELGASYFKVTNPNATANCGCGASFSI